MFPKKNLILPIYMEIVINALDATPWYTKYTKVQF